MSKYLGAEGLAIEGFPIDWITKCAYGSQIISRRGKRHQHETWEFIWKKIKYKLKLEGKN